MNIDFEKFMKSVIFMLTIFAGIVLINIISEVGAGWLYKGFRFLERANGVQIIAIIVFVIFALHRFGLIKKKK